MAVSLVLNRNPGVPLWGAIRESVALTGTEFGRGIAQCVACAVHLEGRPIRSCVTRVSAAARKSVTTIEGVSGPAALVAGSTFEKLRTPLARVAEVAMGSKGRIKSIDRVVCAINCSVPVNPDIIGAQVESNLAWPEFNTP